MRREGKDSSKADVIGLATTPASGARSTGHPVQGRKWAAYSSVAIHGTLWAAPVGCRSLVLLEKSESLGEKLGVFALGCCWGGGMPGKGKHWVIGVGHPQSLLML